MKILICEDDIMTRKAIEHRLKFDGYDIITAQDGREAVKKLEEDTIDFVLTDIHMPYISGLELITHIRSKLKLSIPVVILTRVGIEDTVLEAFELGADDYITKPFSPNELSLRIKKLTIKK